MPKYLARRQVLFLGTPKCSTSYAEAEPEVRILA